MPKVRLSSGTIGTIRLPICLSRSSVLRMRTNAIVVEISRPSVAFNWASKVESGGISSDSDLAPARRQAAAERRPALPQVDHLRAVLGQLEERHLLDLVVGDRQAEAVAELLQHRLAHLLLLVGDVLALAGLAHAVALDGLRQDHGRLALVRHGRRIGGVDLAGIVAAARQAPDLLVGHVGDAGLQLRVLAEEVLADIGAVLGLEVLVLAVDAFLHAAQQAAVGVGRDQRVPRAAPDHLDDVPARAPEVAFQFLDDLAVAAHRAVEALEVAVDDEDQIVELLAAAERDGAQALRLVHLTVAHEGPDLAVGGVGQTRGDAGTSGTGPDRSPSAAPAPSRRSGTARSPASARDAGTTTARCRRLPRGS